MKGREKREREREREKERERERVRERERERERGNSRPAVYMYSIHYRTFVGEAQVFSMSKESLSLECVKKHVYTISIVTLLL